MELEVACRPHVGWTVDYGDFDAGSRGRLNLRQALLGIDDGRPDVPADAVDLSRLAAVLARHMDLSDEDLADLPRVHPAPPGLSRLGPTPRVDAYEWVRERDGRRAYLVNWVAAWLRWRGFTECTTVMRGSREVVSDPWLVVSVHAGEAQVALALVQRAHAQAALAGKRAVVVTGSSLSEPARRWADQAGVMVLGCANGVPQALNSVAAAYLTEPDPLPARCDEQRCQWFGRQRDSYMPPCPDDEGRDWERFDPPRLTGDGEALVGPAGGDRGSLHSDPTDPEPTFETAREGSGGDVIEENQDAGARAAGVESEDPWPTLFDDPVAPALDPPRLGTDEDHDGDEDDEDDEPGPQEGCLGDLDDLARDLFSFWVGGAEFEWAEYAWWALTEKGLAT
ncbi:hypothetical protein [Kineococcus sp. NUM-3379]